MTVETHKKYGEEYFDYLKYSEKGQLIWNHVLETLKWGSKVSGLNLLDGNGKNALDVGCAFGYGLELLNSFGYEALGTDVSVYGLRQAKRKNRKIDFTACDTQRNLPFKRKFDLVTCFEVLEHLENPLAALQNMYDLCDDVILCTTPNKTFERIVKKLIRDFDKTHVSVKTPREWENQIRNTLRCESIWVDCFMDVSFRMSNKWFYKSLNLPFGMETRILIRK